MLDTLTFKTLTFKVSSISGSNLAQPAQYHVLRGYATSMPSDSQGIEYQGVKGLAPGRTVEPPGTAPHCLRC